MLHFKITAPYCTSTSEDSGVMEHNMKMARPNVKIKPAMNEAQMGPVNVSARIVVTSQPPGIGTINL